MAAVLFQRLRVLRRSITVLSSVGKSPRGATMARSYETLEVTRPAEWVVQVQLNRPEKNNAMNIQTFWRELLNCFEGLAGDSECRAVVVSGAGKNFSAGLDQADHDDLFSAFMGNTDVARETLALRRMVKSMQDSCAALEKCPKPVIAAIHSACMGAGMDLVTACDIRLCSSDTWFQIKEVEIGLAADIGTLQRLPKVVGNVSLARELVYTARKFSAEEALAMGLVSHVHPDREATVVAALNIAKTIASKSPVAVQGSKVILNYSRDHSVDEGLEYVLTWNSAMLQTEDIANAVQAAMTKEQPVFSKL